MTINGNKRAEYIDKFLHSIPFIWISLSLLAVLGEVLKGPDSFNNYFIYKGVFQHLVAQKNLYLAYPSEYFDINHYGPLFSLIIAPFSFLPDEIGCVLWSMVNSGILLYAIMQLGLSHKKILIIAAIVLIENMTAIHNVQFNPMLAASIILAFVMVRKNNLLLATLFIMIGTLTKLYGIVGLAFFFFSPNKRKFFNFSVLWFVVLFCLPMLISSPAYILNTYMDWYHTLAEKNLQNYTAMMQDISAMGMIQRVFGLKEFSNSVVLFPAMVLTLLPILNKKNWIKTDFQYLYLAQLMIGLVVFSSSSESPTYVIAVSGVAVWFVIQKHPIPHWVKFTLAFVLLLTVLSPTDLTPSYLKENFIKRYALKALPCLVVWLIATFQLYFPAHAKTSIDAQVC